MFSSNVADTSACFGLGTRQPQLCKGQTDWATSKSGQEPKVSSMVARMTVLAAVYSFGRQWIRKMKSVGISQ